MTSDATPALQAERLSKRYGRNSLSALDAVDISVPRGSITALVGPNGAGKTSIIRCWMGFERPSAGHALVSGKDPQVDRKAVIRSIGYVSQAVGVYRGLAVSDHLDLAGTLRPGFDRQTAAARLDQFQIPLRQRAGTLSGGQAAQLLLAIALATHASVLLLDEPLAALDPLARHEFLNALHDEVRAEGATALLSSHIVSDVAEVCDRVIVLARGNVLLDNEIVKVLNSHRLVEKPPTDQVTVAPLVGPGGDKRWLIQSDDRALPVPTLEELSMAYLAASRDSARSPETLQ